MVGERLTPGSSNCGDSLHPPAGSVRLDRDVPLNFWFGYKKIGTVKFLMEVEILTIDPFGTDLPQAPIQTSLKASLDGVYRPSEPLSPTTPLFSVANSQIRYIESSFERRFIDLKTDFESYMSKFSGKTRSNIRRKVRKFEEASGGQIEWSVYRSAAAMDCFHSLAREISKLIPIPADQFGLWVLGYQWKLTRPLKRAGEISRCGSVRRRRDRSARWFRNIVNALLRSYRSAPGRVLSAA